MMQRNQSQRSFGGWDIRRNRRCTHGLRIGDKPWQKPNGFRGVNTAEHPRQPSADLKISAIRACFEEDDVQLMSAQIGYSTGPAFTPGAVGI